MKSLVFSTIPCQVNLSFRPQPTFVALASSEVADEKPSVPFEIKKPRFCKLTTRDATYGIGFFGLWQETFQFTSESPASARGVAWPTPVKLIVPAKNETDFSLKKVIPGGLNQQFFATAKLVFRRSGIQDANLQTPLIGTEDKSPTQPLH